MEEGGRELPPGFPSSPLQREEIESAGAGAARSVQPPGRGGARRRCDGRGGPREERGEGSAGEAIPQEVNRGGGGRGCRRGGGMEEVVGLELGSGF